MHRRPGLAEARIQLDLAESLLVVQQVLLQNGVQRFGLLRAEIDSLIVAHLDTRLILLLQGAEDQEEVPYIHAHLHAVGIVFAIVGRIRQID